MNHTMEQCRTKLEAIRSVSLQGRLDASDCIEVSKFDQILQDVEYLLRETHPDNEIRTTILRMRGEDAST